MARIYEDRGELDAAIRLLQRTVEIDRKTGHPDLESDSRYLTQLRQKL